MIRRPPRSTQSRSSAASDVYKRQPLQCCWRHPNHVRLRAISSAQQQWSDAEPNSLYIVAAELALGVWVAQRNGGTLSRCDPPSHAPRIVPAFRAQALSPPRRTVRVVGRDGRIRLALARKDGSGASFLSAVLSDGVSSGGGTWNVGRSSSSSSSSSSSISSSSISSSSSSSSSKNDQHS